MTVRAKFTLMEIHSHHWNNGKTFLFTPEYDETIEEDRRFAKATPNGEFRMYVDNPTAIAHFKLGEKYYVDFIPLNATDPDQS